MKIATEVEENIQRSGLLHEKQFGIIFDHKMSRILSDGLYQDKIASIIREISCNAVDSHVEAGRATEPFEVHLPTSLEPWFSVTDFGVGLSSQQVKRIYTIYGSSTKTQSNDVIGQLGLGSKSPFSYADAFDVIAIKDGLRSCYSMYKDEYGMPCCAELVANQNTDEPDGVTVKIPVAIKDISEWHRKAQAIYKWFPVVPRMTGYQIEIAPDLYTWSAADWGIMPGEIGYYSERFTPIALMGNVAYPINIKSIQNSLSEQQTACLEKCKLVLKFAIGDLEVTASREGLSYDARTIANIKQKLDILIREIKPHFEVQLAQARTLWEAHKIYGQLQKENRGQYHAMFFPNGLKWQNQLINSSTFTIKAEEFYNLVERADPVTGNLVKVPDAEMKVIKKDSGYKRPHRVEYNTLQIEASDKIRIFVCDIKTGANIKLMHNHQDYWTYYMFYLTPKLTLAKLKKLLGDVEILPISQLTSPPKTAKATSPTLKILNFNWSAPNSWVEQPWDRSTGGVYVELDRWDIRCFGRNYTALTFEKLRTDLIAAGLIDKSLVISAGRQKTKKEMTADPKWLSLEEHVKQTVNNANLVKRIEDIQILNLINASDRQFDNLLSTLCNQPLTNTASPFELKLIQLQDIMKSVQEQKYSLQKFNEMMGVVGIGGDQIPIVHATNSRFKTVIDVLNSIKQQYPGLQHMKNAVAIKLYVDLVDENHYLREQLSLTIPAE